MEAKDKNAMPGKSLDNQDLDEATGGFGGIRLAQYCPQCGYFLMVNYIKRDCPKCGYRGEFKPSFP